MSYTELHFHLLPGVDDGPGTLEESVELARAAAREGTRTIVATPHVHDLFMTDVSSLPERAGAVRRALREAGIQMRVLCGGELSHQMVPRLSNAELEVIAQGPPGRRWLLLEAPLTGISAEFAAAAAELRGRGFGALIAHPERALLSSPEAWTILEGEIAAGSGLQINAWSIAGLYGADFRRDALRLLRTPALATVASDAHGPGRLPSLRLALRALRAMRIAQAEELVSAIPTALLLRGLPASPMAAAA